MPPELHRVRRGRYFVPGDLPCVFQEEDPLGVNICEDTWGPQDRSRPAGCREYRNQHLRGCLGAKAPQAAREAARRSGSC